LNSVFLKLPTSFPNSLELCDKLAMERFGSCADFISLPKKVAGEWYGLCKFLQWFTLTMV